VSGQSLQHWVEAEVVSQAYLLECPGAWAWQIGGERLLNQHSATVTQPIQPIQRVNMVHGFVRHYHVLGLHRIQARVKRGEYFPLPEAASTDDADAHAQFG
jgi:hypothetical protein